MTTSTSSSGLRCPCQLHVRTIEVGRPAPSERLRIPVSSGDLGNVALGREGLESTVLGLEFIVRQKHFKRGNMKLKCLATISNVYLVSNEESMERERPQKAAVMESRGTATPLGSRADRVQGKYY
ncbi:unnamed protein product [Phaedon cochleariae]|uniref:Uncharacterized protein n=1 Tax=Phaedon cochleariae TaxID=80249 RepID=A0A9N9SH29_PHACE|nr:unnamed protein product [Phaedon cochleariae]